MVLLTLIDIDRLLFFLSLVNVGKMIMLAQASIFWDLMNHVDSNDLQLEAKTNIVLCCFIYRK